MLQASSSESCQDSGLKQAGDILSTCPSPGDIFPAMVAVPGMLEILALMGVTVHMVLESPQAMVGARKLDVAELWSGVGSVKKAAEDRGFRAAVMDKDRAPGVTDKPGPYCEDIISKDGFAFAVRLVLSFCPGGLLVMAPTCAPVVRMSTGKTGRSKVNPGTAAWKGQRQHFCLHWGRCAACTACVRTLHGPTCSSSQSGPLASSPSTSSSRAWRDAPSTDPPRGSASTRF